MERWFSGQSICWVWGHEFKSLSCKMLGMLKCTHNVHNPAIKDQVNYIISERTEESILMFISVLWTWTDTSLCTCAHSKFHILHFVFVWLFECSLSLNHIQIVNLLEFLATLCGRNEYFFNLFFKRIKTLYFKPY